MKILCVVPSYWPAFEYGGPIYSVHYLNKELVKRGINVTVYTTNIGLRSRVPVNRVSEIDDVKVLYFNFSQALEFLGETGWQFSWQMTRALSKNIKYFDIIYLPAVWNYPTIATAFCAKKYRKPYVISPRGALYPYTLSKKAWKKRLYYKIIIKKVLLEAAAIHYTTEDEAEKCHSFLGLTNKNYFVVPNGIDLSDFSKLPDRKVLREHYPMLKHKKVLLFLGRITWKKGLDLLIKAYSRLSKKRDDVHLLIAGPDEGGYKKKVIGLLKDAGVLERVTFTGMLLGERKLAAYVGSDLFVLPSYSENFGMAVVEAMACGLPVVISDQVGIYKEVEKAKAGIVIKPNSDSLYAALIELLNNEEKARQMGTRGRQLVEEIFSIEKVADKMIKAFREIGGKE